MSNIINQMDKLVPGFADAFENAMGPDGWNKVMEASKDDEEEILTDEELEEEELEEEDEEDDEACEAEYKESPAVAKSFGLLDRLTEAIKASEESETEKQRILELLEENKQKKVNIMLVGATGSGKSSTINAMFDMEVAKVGVGVDPETAEIQKYELDNLVIWDTPGLGDGVEQDIRHKNAIVKKMNELDEDGNPVIDMVIVILDASSKDLGTSYDFINHLLVPCLGSEEAKSRILIAINQCDMAMKGRHWDEANNAPDEVLKATLEEKAASVKRRIREATGLDLEPMYYCAGYKEGDEEQRKPYNLTKLLFRVLEGIPKEKRLLVVDNLNQDAENWEFDDEEEDYESGVIGSVSETLLDLVKEGASVGSEILGDILGIPGKLVGGIVGGAVGVVGAAVSVVGGFFATLFDW